jgi:hypothetical protein
MIKRQAEQALIHALDKFPVVCLTGPRQCGKTTLAKMVCQQIGRKAIYIDLEKIEDQRRISDAGLFFQDNRDSLIVFDEIQRYPDLIPQIRAEVDFKLSSGRFLILGSASPDIILSSSETLAGRISFLGLTPFLLPEVTGIVELNDLFFWGGFPKVVLDADPAFRQDWLDNFIYTYVERDLPLLGIKASPRQVRQLWGMLAYQSGGLLNTSSIGRSLGITSHTVSGYLDFLEEAFMIARIDPFYTNIGKRLVRSKKVYISDTGILHRLLGLRNRDQLMGTPLAGNSWETFVVSQLVPLLRRKWNYWYYRTQTGVEVDLVLGTGIIPEICIEIKLSSAPAMTRSFTTAINDLKTRENYIVIPFGESYRVREDVTVCSLPAFLKILEAHG